MDVAHFSTGNVTQLMYKFKPLLAFANTSGDAERLIGLIEYIRKTWKKDRPARFGTLAYEASTSRQGEDPRLFKLAKEKGVEFLPFDYYPFTVTDFSTELRRIHAVKKADYLWLRGGCAQVAAIMKDVLRLGLKDKMKYVSTYFGTDDVVTKIAGKEACAGMLGEIAVPLPDEDLPGVKLAKRIRAKYRKGSTPVMYLDGFHLAMVAHEVTKRALEKVGLKKLGGRAIAEQVWGLKDFNVGGLSPPITMQQGNISLKRYVHIVKWQEDGKIVTVSDWMMAPWILGRD